MKVMAITNYGSDYDYNFNCTSEFSRFISNASNRLVPMCSIHIEIFPMAWCMLDQCAMAIQGSCETNSRTSASYSPSHTMTNVMDFLFNN